MRRRDIPVAKDGSSLVLREYLLRRSYGLEPIPMGPGAGGAAGVMADLGWGRTGSGAPEDDPMMRVMEKAKQEQRARNLSTGRAEHSAHNGGRPDHRTYTSNTGGLSTGRACHSITRLLFCSM